MNNLIHFTVCQVKWVLVSILSVFWVIIAFSQNETNNQTVYFSETKDIHTIGEVFDDLEKRYHIIISYNASQINPLDKINNLKECNGLDISNCIIKILSRYQIKLISQKPNKYIVLVQGEKVIPTRYRISGKVTDKTTGEAINGVIIFDEDSQNSVISNEDGYFTISLPMGEVTLQLKYLGYRTLKFKVNVTHNHLVFPAMEVDNQLPLVTISDSGWHHGLNLYNSGEITKLYQYNEFRSLSGEIDPLQNVKALPGVQSGGEGQTGFFVRGGNPSENLVLMDGMKVYEPNHVGGLASIFINETVKEATLIKNGFPARYSGHLSSVLDVSLKDGDKFKHRKQVSIGLASAKVHFEGPIWSGKTTYNVAFRSSILRPYINGVLRKFTNYNDINLQYSDVIGKISHFFSPTSVVSIAFYKGSDRLSLLKDETINAIDYTVNAYNQNSIRWSNTMFSIKYNQLLSDKWALKLQAGYLRYKTFSRSTYEFSKSSVDSLSESALDVISESNIKEIGAKSDVEYYYNSNNVFRFGIQFSQPKLNPTIKQSQVVLQGQQANIIDPDSVLTSTDLNFYFEDNIKIGTKLFIYAGLNLSIFKNQGSAIYSNLQPRLNFIYNPHPNHTFSASFSRMAQNIHHLTNHGIGLPSGLWVPSTQNVLPEIADQWSVGYSAYVFKTFNVNIGAYTKKYDNAIEFTAPTDLFYLLLKSAPSSGVFNQYHDWQKNVIFGKSDSKGIECIINKKKGKTQGWISAAYSKTSRIFPDIDNGKAFPSTYDRTIDANVTVVQYISKQWSLQSQFVYGTGNTFSLATEEFNSILDIQLLKSNGRNNYRLPPFHQLTLSAHFKKTFDLFEFMLSVSVYNVYNRLNPYYIYIYRDAQNPDDYFLKKVSVLPITPIVNFSIQF